MTQWKNLRDFFSRQKEKVEITVETKESWEVHWFKKSRAELCRVCKAETIFVPTNLAAQIVRAEKVPIENLLTDEEIHFRQSSNEEKLVCLASLKRALEKHSTQIFFKEN